MRVNENIAYAKSILNKSGINQDSPEYQDYLKIREIVGNDNGYVGILTKLRFVDNVTDVEELKSIYEILKKQKFDFAKLNKLTYEQILDMFYDELSGEKNKNEDLELIFKDSQYSYYRVYTYKGILKIGSPTWCLKTKSKWDEYQKEYPEQWVVIDNQYKNKLVTPEDDLINNYVSNKVWIRYGVSLKRNVDTVDWVACDDNNNMVKFYPASYTFFGVMCTILNLNVGIKKSYYEKFIGCERYNDSTWHKVIDVDKFSDRMDMDRGRLNSKNEMYVNLSRSYSNYVVMLCLNDTYPLGLWLHNKKPEMSTKMSESSMASRIIEDYASRSNNEIWHGVNIKKGVITIDDVKKHSDLVTIIDDKWGVYDRSNNYYVVVNLNPTVYQLPSMSLPINNKGKEEYCYDMTEPLFWYLSKDNMKPYMVKFEGMNDIVDKLNKKGIPEIKPEVKEDPVVKNDGAKTETEKVKSFLDFFRRNK